MASINQWDLFIDVWINQWDLYRGCIKALIIIIIIISLFLCIRLQHNNRQIAECYTNFLSPLFIHKQVNMLNKVDVLGVKKESKFNNSDGSPTISKAQSSSCRTCYACFMLRKSISLLYTVNFQYSQSLLLSKWKNFDVVLSQTVWGTKTNKKKSQLLCVMLSCLRVKYFTFW